MSSDQGQIIGCLDRLPLTALVAFEYLDGAEEHHYMPLLDDHHETEGVMITTRSILWMRIEREEMLQADVQFESKAQLNLYFGPD